MNKKMLIVGGNWNLEGGKTSSIIQKLASELGAESRNGGFIDDLINIAKYLVKEYSTIVWMPNVENSEEKYYPEKATGSVLICSKVMRKGYNRFESVSRIFKMHANAVIEIHKGLAIRDEVNYEQLSMVPLHKTMQSWKFCLVDALNNEWVVTDEIKVLADEINKFIKWNSEVKRIGCKKLDVEAPTKPENLIQLCEITKVVADKVESERGGRFFGNASTRCMKMFPNMRDSGGAWISARNVDKHRITPEDFVYSKIDNESVLFCGERKPSVDAPVQLEIFKNYPKINYMVHGHAFIKNAPCTEEYYPCGDMREIEPLFTLLNCYKILNLKNHGFLIVAQSIQELKNDVCALVEQNKFINIVPPSL